MEYKEKAIRAIVASSVKSYAQGFSDRHISERDNENGTINMKIHNVFIAALGPEIQYYSALARSLDSSLGNMLESMAITIAELHYTVNQHVEGKLYKAQTDYIAEILEEYKNHTQQSRELFDGTCIKELFSKTYKCSAKVEKRPKSQVLQFFLNEEPHSYKNFWNFVCKSERGYEIVMDEINKNARYLEYVLNFYKRIKLAA